MDPFSFQVAKNKFAESQTPPIDPCTNIGCKFTGCTCGKKCGCHLQKNDIEVKSCDASSAKSDGRTNEGGLVQCDPCLEFKTKKKIELEST